MKKGKTFNVGDKVFAKVKGYPPWPAQITGVNGKKYNVEFYGTKEIGQIKTEDLAYYLKNKEKFGKSKRLGFPEAIEQIEIAIKENGGDGDDNLEESLSENNLETSSNASFSSLNSSIVDKTDKKSNKRKRESSEESIPTKKLGRASRRSSRAQSDVSETKDIERVEVKIKDEKELKDAAESEWTMDENEESETMDKKDILEEDSEPKTTEPEFVAIQNSSIAQTADSFTEEKSDNNPKILSENPDKADIVSLDMLKNNILYAEHVSNHEDIYKNCPVEEREDTENQLLPVSLPSGIICGLKLHQKWPIRNFENEYDRAMYDDRIAKKILEQKEKLEKGPKALVSTIPNLVGNIHMTMNDIKAILYERDISSKEIRVKRLKIESNMVSLEQKIKNCLGLDMADPKTAVVHLEELLAVEFDSLMLKKHPHVVEMAHRLRKYVGNTKEWNMSEEEAAEFKKQAEKIRDGAERLYLKIEAAMGVPEGQTSFWDSFQEILVKFREKCRELTESQVYVLCSEPLSRTAFIDNLNEATLAEKVASDLAKGTQSSRK